LTVLNPSHKHNKFPLFHYYSTHVQQVLTVQDIKMLAKYNMDTNYNKAVFISLLDNNYNNTKRRYQQ